MLVKCINLSFINRSDTMALSVMDHQYFRESEPSNCNERVVVCYRDTALFQQKCHYPEDETRLRVQRELS